MNKADPIKLIAIYLPQFHPIPENDLWWGKGFTEWTNVVKARPRFPGHYQPHLPADLGFYDLRLPEVRLAQAEMARNYGIHGFCYYHYWFNGKRLLERPVNEILSSGQPDFPFCICWANENWTRVWDGGESEILMEQLYSEEDDREHIRSLIPMFRDPRYIRIDGKPLFIVYRARRFPDPRHTTFLWRREAELAGLPGLYLVRVESFPDETDDPISLGFDAALEFQPRWSIIQDLRMMRKYWWHRQKLRTADPVLYENFIYSYNDLVDRALRFPLPNYPFMRCVTPGWDNSARRTKGASILEGSTPESYKRWLRAIVGQAQVARSDRLSSRLIFVNAWNEWAEGNHLEPDHKWKNQYLEATREVLQGANSIVTTDRSKGL